MDIIVFGDDWQSHPSTTQHLINHFPKSDRIIWCNSIGMRAPSFSIYDIKRLLNKALSIITTPAQERETNDDRLAALIQPRVLPFHKNSWIKRLNKGSMSRMLARLNEQYKLHEPVVLTSNPVVTDYLPDWLRDRVHYLRLDDYALFGGVDKSLALVSERETFNKAKHVFYTARNLKPSKIETASTYLPQGVSSEKFRVNTVPDGPYTIGYFGLIEPSRFDFDLIQEVADKNPDWTLEFLGDVTYCPDSLKQYDNIVFKKKVKFNQLSDATEHWHAAWIPYKVNALTCSINPLKVREYIAMGLPVVSSAMPEVMAINADIRIYMSADDISDHLADIIETENNQFRVLRAGSVAAHTWVARSEQLRAILCA